MDADYDPTQRQVKTKKKKKGKIKLDKSAMQEDLTSRKRRRSKFAQALEKPKPQFDASLWSLFLSLFCSFSVNLFCFVSKGLLFL